MDLEARSLQPSLKATLLAKLREYKTDLNSLKNEAKRITSANASITARDELLESGRADSLAVSLLPSPYSDINRYHTLFFLNCEPRLLLHLLEMMILVGSSKVRMLTNLYYFKDLFIVKAMNCLHAEEGQNMGLHAIVHKTYKLTGVF